MTHYLGHKLAETPQDRWATEAKLDWTVEESPVFYRAGDQALVDEDRKILFKSDDPKVVFGAVGSGFQAVQPDEILKFYSELENETGFRVQAAGMLRNKRIFVTATNDQSVKVGGHDVQNYLVGGTENGGGMSTRISPTNVRPVCENTLAMALSSRLTMAVTHRTKVDWKAVKKWVTQEHEAFSLYGDLMQALYEVPVTIQQGAEFAKNLLAKDWDGSKEKTPRKLEKFSRTATQGKGQAEALNNGQPNAFWLMNAFTRYTDHDMHAHSNENRADNALFGQGAALKQQMMDRLLRDCVQKWHHDEPARIADELRAIR